MDKIILFLTNRYIILLEAYNGVTPINAEVMLMDIHA